jgi:hypothetical protein
MSRMIRVSAVLGAAGILAASVAAKQVVPVQGPPRGAAGIPQGPAAQQPTILKAGNGVIVGRVVEAGSSSGVAGALVLLQSPVLGGMPSTFDDGTLAGTRRAFTDSQGQFLFRGLPAGSYTLTSAAPGFVPGQYGDQRLIQIRRSLDLNRTVELTDLDKLANISIQMWRNGGIGGRVVDEVGEPMVGTPVSVLARVADWSGTVTQSRTTVTTDDRGVYHADVPPGDYIVGVLAATTTMPTTSIEGFNQAMREGGATLQAFTRQVAESGGLMPRGYGSRVGSFMVSQFGTLNAPVVPPTAGDGMFYPSTYHPTSLTAPAATVVRVGSSEEKLGVDIQLRPVPTRRLSGRLVDANGPVGGLALSLVAPDPTVQRTSPATLIDTPRALADSNGAFSFIGIAPGTYTLFVSRPASSQASPILWAAQTVTIGADADVQGLEVVLQPGARVGGQIVIETAKPFNNAQLSRLLIVPRAVPGSVGALVPAGATYVERPTPETFATREHIPGPYAMTVSGGIPGFVVKSITLNGQNVMDKPFDLPASGVTGMVVTFSDRISMLSGYAREGSTPSPLATVIVFPTDKSLWRLPGMASRRVQTAAPGSDGRYAFAGLPSGEYYVAAVDWPDADFSDGAVLTSIIPSAVRVTIGDGTPHTQDLRVLVRR